jgi:hypothetical protein
MRTCPRCLRDLPAHPAVGRTDNESRICSACGTDEAMEDWLGQLIPRAHWPAWRSR